MTAIRGAWLGCAWLLVSACSTLNSYTNEPLPPKPAPPAARAPAPAPRATFEVSAERGNPRVLTLLALSGGGSRAAYFSAAVMLRLQTVFPGRDLLREVDAVSSVSGGSIAAAYYAVSKDARIDDAAIAAAVAPSAPGQPIAPQKLRRTGSAIGCSAPLTGDETAALRARLAGASGVPDAAYAERRVVDLCRQATVASNRVWDAETVKDLMTRNYVKRWIGNWFWPRNIAYYWFTAYDRSDLMAQTLADNLYDVAITGRDLVFAELNPERPYLLINSTNATGDYPNGDGFPFGAPFTFTTDDFRDRIRSDLSQYSVARAVMASASFPVVFANMTLRDFRAQPDGKARYVHVFDGGNSDNLGLATLKRLLLEAALDGRIASYDRIVVISIDAFTRPTGTPSTEPDSRGGFFDFLLDTNLTSAIDSLLQANRSNNLEQFSNLAFTWKECGNAGLRTYPSRLCDAIARLGSGGLSARLGLDKRLVFYHIGFEDVGDATIDVRGADGKIVKQRLIDRLNLIPTSLAMEDPDRQAIDAAVNTIVTPQNDCLRAIFDIVEGRSVSPAAARRACNGAAGAAR